MGSFEYVNSKKLICYTPSVMGPGEIIISTFSGGVGKCTVTFTGLEPEKANLLGTMVERGGANVDSSGAWNSKDGCVWKNY